MKFFIILALLGSSYAFSSQMEVYETTCKKHYCFKYGWVTTSELGYKLDTACKKRDCARFGWHSVANDNSSYDVDCRTGGCFTDGWTSIQEIDGEFLYDDVFCKEASCLNHGWNVRTGYDLMGGDVTCNQGDCSRFGGKSFWRGRPSETVCYKGDCYKYGWTLYIY